MSYCSDITKNRILECAKGEFLSKGFENAQVAEIAKLAKVTTGAIYRHFKNKEALFFALIEEEYNYTLDVVSDVEKRSEQKTIRIDSDLVDDEAIIENLFLETMLFVDYMYAHLYASAFFMIYRMIMLANILEALLFFNIMVGKA